MLITETFCQHFTIYSFEELFANLYNIISVENNDAIKFDNIIASIKLKNDPFDYKKSIQCEVSFLFEIIEANKLCKTIYFIAKLF